MRRDRPGDRDAWQTVGEQLAGVPRRSARPAGVEGFSVTGASPAWTGPRGAASPPGAEHGVGDRTQPIPIVGFVAQPATRPGDPRRAVPLRPPAGVQVDPLARRPGKELTVTHTYAGRSSRRRRLVVTLVAVLALVCAGYAACVLYFADRVPRDTTVGGIDVGAMKVDQAAATLDKSYKEKSTQPLSVSIMLARDIKPQRAGLSFDARASVSQYQGMPWSPADLWRRIAGDGARPLITTVNRNMLTSEVQAIARDLDQPAKNGNILFVNGIVRVQQPADGFEVDVDGAVDLLARKWLTGAQPIVLPSRTTKPVIGTEELALAQKQISDPLSTKPLKVRVGGVSVTLPPSAVMPAASVNVVKGKLALQIDADVITAAVRERLPEGLETSAASARFVFHNGRPTIVQGAPGRRIDPDSLAASVTGAAVATDKRVATAKLVQVGSRQDVAQLSQMGVKEVVAGWTTRFEDNNDRSHNIRRGAARINARLVKPGQTFSLSRALGARTASNGYRDVPAAAGDESGVGGGVDQVAATLYNAAHLAGLEDVEHTPHATYHARYPMVREATLWEGVSDLKFRNNTPYGVLIEAGVDLDTSTLSIRLWSTHYWDVESVIGQPVDYLATSSESKAAGPDCVAQAAGSEGFTATEVRKLWLNGKLESTQSWSWTYQPVNAVTCD